MPTIIRPQTTDIPCIGYAVKADVYKGSRDDAVVLSLIGRTSQRTRQRYREFSSQLASEGGATVVVFDYTGHGDSPYNIEDLCPAQHLLEVITVFDWIKARYPNRNVFVIGSSYGGFLAAHLRLYRKFDGLILRAPALYRPQDFYTLKKHEDRQAIQQFRHDALALAQHPLFTHAPQYTCNTLLIVHENDERIPTEVTDAYAGALHPEIIVAKNTPHSLSDMPEQYLAAYNQQMIDWIAKQQPVEK